MHEHFETHAVDTEKEYARALARSEAIRRASETPEVTPLRTPEETDLSGGEQNSGRTPASR